MTWVCKGCGSDNVYHSVWRMMNGGSIACINPPDNAPWRRFCGDCLEDCEVETADERAERLQATQWDESMEMSDDR